MRALKLQISAGQGEATPAPSATINGLRVPTTKSDFASGFRACSSPCEEGFELAALELEHLGVRRRNRAWIRRQRALANGVNAVLILGASVLREGFLHCARRECDVAVLYDIGGT
jgi:hypothetical protein